VAEPGKFVELRSAGLDALPSALLRHTAIGVRLWRTGQLYVTVDWPAPVEESA
jgi:hypothetical protein